MRKVSLMLVGFGNVGRAFARLLLKKRSELEQNFGLVLDVTGIATQNHGIAFNPGGLDLQQAVNLVEKGQTLSSLSKGQPPSSILEFIQSCPAEVLFENSPVNYQTGQPAVDYLRAGLERGLHAVTANKGPVVHAYRELTDLAASHERRFLFESAVMDGAPIFSVFREALPTAKVLGFEGVLNSCTNMILERMETGETLEEAIQYAQSIGIAETDPSGDVDGWDAAVKVAALATVLMGEPLKPDQVERQGIRAVTREMISEASAAGEKWKLVCRASRKGGRFQASVAPRRVDADSPLYSVRNTSSFVQFETDVLPGLGILEGNPSPDTTAYGLFADLLNILKNGD